MKIILWIVVAAAIVGLGVFAYIRFATKPAPAGEALPGSPLPLEITKPVPASSYGKNAVGNETNAKIQPSQITPSEVGVLMGTAKPAPGAKPDFASIKISISDPKTKNVLDSMNLDASMSYKFIVAPGEYVLNIVSGTGKSDQLPQRIYVGAGESLNVNFFVK